MHTLTVPTTLFYRCDERRRDRSLPLLLPLVQWQTLLLRICNHWNDGALDFYTSGDHEPVCGASMLEMIPTS